MIVLLPCLWTTKLMSDFMVSMQVFFMGVKRNSLLVNTLVPDLSHTRKVYPLYAGRLFQFYIGQAHKSF